MMFTIQLELHKKANQTDVLVFALQENLTDTAMKIFLYFSQSAIDCSMCKISVRLDSPVIYQTTINLYKEQLDVDVITDFLGDATLAASEVMSFGFSGEESLVESSEGETIDL